MGNYLIEYRVKGVEKGKIKRLIYEVNKKLRIKIKKRPVPHITIISQFTTNKQRDLVRDFKQVCENHSKINFDISGYGWFENSRAVYININPSEEMLRFRENLIKRLWKYSKIYRIDVFSFLWFKKINKYLPHITIAMKLSPHKFIAIKDYISKKEKPVKKCVLARVTLIKNKRILYEYDFLQKRLLNRKEALNKD